MSIYPNGKPANLRYKWEVAALDVPVPATLINKADVEEWKNYVDCLSPAQKLRKFGQALDQLHSLLTQAEKSPPSDQEKADVFSKWYAASVVSVGLAGHLQYTVEAFHKNTGEITSDIDYTLFVLLDFLKEANSTDIKIWEDRRARYRAVNEEVLDLAIGYGMNSLRAPNANPAPKP